MYIIFLHFLAFLFLISFSYAFQFNTSGDFTILQFTDLHYGEDSAKDDITQDLQRRILSLVKPDLVVVSGDGVTGYKGYHFFGLLKRYGFYKKHWERFTLPFKEANIPYAFIMGNHDAEGDLTAKEIINLDKSNPLSVLGMSEGREMPDTTNYYIPIYSSKNSSQLAANIWMFDTGNKGCAGVEDTWGCLEENEINWYDIQSKKLKDQYGENVHHLAFLHIPVPEFLSARNENKISGVTGDVIGCASVNSGFFDRVKLNEDIQAIYVGHDHQNDFEGSYEGVDLIYGRKTGYGNYGNIHGARVIKLKEVKNATTGEVTVQRTQYVISEDGKIVDKGAVTKRMAVQFVCDPVKAKGFVKLRDTGIFEYIRIGLMVLVSCGLLFCFVKKVFKVIMRIKNPKIDEHEEMKDESVAEDPTKKSRQV